MKISIFFVLTVCALGAVRSAPAHEKTPLPPNIEKTTLTPKDVETLEKYVSEVEAEKQRLGAKYFNACARVNELSEKRRLLHQQLSASEKLYARVCNVLETMPT